MVFISKKQQKQQQKTAERIFKKTGQRVGFAAGIGGPKFLGKQPANRPRDITDLGCANCFPRGSFKGNVRGILQRADTQEKTGRGQRPDPQVFFKDPNKAREFFRKSSLSTGRAKKQLTQEELLLLRERGLI